MESRPPWPPRGHSRLSRGRGRGERVVVERRGVRVECEVGLEVNHGRAVADERALHARAGLERERELVHASGDVERLRVAAARERELAVGRGEHDRPHLVLEELEVGGRADGVRRRGVLGVGTGVEDEEVLVNSGCSASLELRSEKVRQRKET